MEGVLFIVNICRAVLCISIFGRSNLSVFTCRNGFGPIKRGVRAGPLRLISPGKQTELSPTTSERPACCSEETNCLAAALISVCVEVLVEDGGERREMREGESFFAGLAPRHSTHRLVFVNYAKLRLLKACQRVHL